jgi:hypothetical protein
MRDGKVLIPFHGAYSWATWTFSEHSGWVSRASGPETVIVAPLPYFIGQVVTGSRLKKGYAISCIFLSFSFFSLFQIPGPAMT